MPIRPEDFPKDGVLRPIYEHIRETLTNKALLPAADGKFIGGVHAMLCTAPDLRRLLTPGILRQLFRPDAPLNWVDGELS